jgi:hypothetical protein
MNLGRRQRLRGRVIDAASAALLAQGYVSQIDVFPGHSLARCRDAGALESGPPPVPLAGIQTAAIRITEAMELFHVWATEQNLDATEITYVAQSPTRATLNFTNTNNPVIERFFLTHWVPRELPIDHAAAVTNEQDVDIELTNVAAAT